jgi:hypothetical protein
MPWDWAFIVLGIVLPFLLVASTDARYAPDIDVFIRWADCLWKRDGSLYKGCSNYATVGALAGGGAMGVLRAVFRPGDTDTLHHLFRYYLAFFDVIQFFLVAAIVRLLGVRKPWRAALIIRAVPSSWVGGPIWGQLEGITQCFLFLAVLGMAWAWRSIARERFVRASLSFWLATGACMLAILTKQLSIFSLPLLGFGVAVAAMQMVGRWRWRGLLTVLATWAAVIGASVFLDRLFTVASRYYGSSLAYVWMSGSNHGDKIAGNGFNIWVLLGRDPASSSLTPFATLHLANHDIPLTPSHCGHALFLLVSLVVVVLFLRIHGLQWLQRPWAPFSDLGLQRFLSTLVFADGLQNLAMAVTLAGTHERFLYHGYAFLLLAGFRLWQKPRMISGRTAAVLVVSAAAYGAFVYSLIGDLTNYLFPVRRLEFMATLHLVLLIVLLDGFWVLKRKVRGFASPRPSLS